jgi:DNA-binding MarR family transcriptional regulator
MQGTCAASQCGEEIVGLSAESIGRGVGMIERREEREQPDESGWSIPALDYPTFRITLLAKVMDRLTIRELAEATDLTYPQWRVLSRLALTEEGLTVGQIAERAWVDRSEVSRAAAELERRGLATRRSNPADRRTPILTITTAGRAVYEPIQASREQFHEALLADLATDERADLDRLLGRIRDAVLKRIGE